MEQVLINLLTNKAVRRGQYSWQWVNKSTLNPSLNNSVTSKLFRLGLVEEINGEMLLTAMGKINATNMKDSNERTN